MPSKIEMRDTTFLREVERLSGAQVGACLQCHKCSTGCPIAEETDLLSSQVMRLVQLGAERELLESRAIWLCASCEACSTRCPMEIDVAAVMDTLRIMAVERAVDIPDKHTQQFNETFLGGVRRHARVHEMSMMAIYKLRTKDFFSDADKAPKMFMKGKLALLPHFPKNSKEVREIFRRSKEEEKNR